MERKEDSDWVKACQWVITVQEDMAEAGKRGENA
jgi:hypothetical protein